MLLEWLMSLPMTHEVTNIWELFSYKENNAPNLLPVSVVSIFPIRRPLEWLLGIEVSGTMGNNPGQCDINSNWKSWQSPDSRLWASWSEPHFPSWGFCCHGESRKTNSALGFVPMAGKTDRFNKWKVDCRLRIFHEGWMSPHCLLVIFLVIKPNKTGKRMTTANLTMQLGKE